LNPSIPSALLSAAILVAAAAPAGAERLTFGWPVPAHVRVTERVKKSDEGATLAYDVDVKRAADGKNLVVSLTRFEFVAVDGADVKDPVVKEQLQPALNAAAALPSLLISPEGRFLDIGDLDKVIDRMVDMEDPGERREQLRKMMKSPQMIALLKQRSGEFWRVWAGMWSGMSLRPGETAKSTMAIPAGGIEMPGTVSHRGGVDGGLVRIEYHAAFDGKSGGRALQDLFGDTLRALGRDAGIDVGTHVDEVHFELGAETVTDPRTLKPKTAAYKRDVSLAAGGKTKRQVESHDYAFDWGPAAAAAKKKGSR
jgi:hypothetical protein